jgi:hypothetical protein
MTQTESNERDAKRYRMLRELICAPEARQDEIAALIGDIIDDDEPTPQAIDRAMDHLLNTLKLV